MQIFGQSFEFEWNEGNRDKNLLKHGVSNEECEEVFFDPDKRFVQSGGHTSGEERLILIGKTKGERSLFVVFTMRAHKIRVISARDLNRKERRLYDEKES